MIIFVVVVFLILRNRAISACLMMFELCSAVSPSLDASANALIKNKQIGRAGGDASIIGVNKTGSVLPSKT